MSLNRWSARRDTIETPIRKALAKVGARVTRISGKGAPDLLVRFRGHLYAFEVKSDKGRRTTAQDVTGWPIVRTVEDALRAIGVTT